MIASELVIASMTGLVVAADSLCLTTVLLSVTDR